MLKVGRTVAARQLHPKLAPIRATTIAEPHDAYRSCDAPTASQQMRLRIPEINRSEDRTMEAIVRLGIPKSGYPRILSSHPRPIISRRHRVPKHDTREDLSYKLQDTLATINTLTLPESRLYILTQ